MLIETLLALALTAGNEEPFELAGAHIGLEYSVLLGQYPEMKCEASCSDPTATLLGHPGNLWVGIGDGAVNQLAFRFVPTLTSREAEYVYSAYKKRYGSPSRRNAIDDCEEWDRPSGAIVLCVTNGLSLTYWKDGNWGVTQSVIPDSVP